MISMISIYSSFERLFKGQGKIVGVNIWDVTLNKNTLNWAWPRGSSVLLNGSQSEMRSTSALIRSYIFLFAAPSSPSSSLHLVIHSSHYPPFPHYPPPPSFLSHYTVASHPASWWFSAARPSGSALCPFDFPPQTTERRAHIQSRQAMQTPMQACTTVGSHIACGEDGVHL